MSTSCLKYSFLTVDGTCIEKLKWQLNGEKQVTVALLSRVKCVPEVKLLAKSNQRHNNIRKHVCVNNARLCQWKPLKSTWIQCAIMPR